YPFGAGTAGAGGFVPLHTANGPNIGNLGFQMRLDRAAGGSLAYFLVSTKEASIPFAGGTVSVDLTPPNPFLFIPIPVVGGGAGQGSASLALPIPAVPSIVGFRIFSQVIVDESAGSASPIALSNPLLHEISWEAEVFVGCSVAGSTDLYQIVDPTTFNIIDQGGNTCSDNCTSALYTHGGSQFFLGSSIQSQICTSSAATHPIGLSTLFSAPGSGCYGLGYHPIFDLVWTLTDPGTGTRELTAIDGNPANPSFGAQMFNTVNMAGGTNLVEIWDMSRSGNLAAVTTLLPNNLILVDTNPQSATFLQVIHQSPVPASPGALFSLVTDVEITPDEEYAVMVVQNVQVPSDVARFHIPTLTWVDHDPSTPLTIEHIGPNSVPAVSIPDSPTWIDFASHGTFAALGGIGNCGWVGRLDFDLADPTVWAFTPFHVGNGYPNAWGGGLSPDDGTIAVTSWDSNSCISSTSGPALHFFDAGNGSPLGTTNLPVNGGSNTLQNLYTVVWR
ncbi:MAG: hypothetical protein ACF8XB_19735, partial [Planctomycetota bacterium JB042]